MKKLPPTPCTLCNNPDCDDWMYHAGLIPANKAICGECKIKIGKEVMKDLANLFKNKRHA